LVFVLIKRRVHNEGGFPRLKQLAQLMAVSIEHGGSQLGKIDQVEPGDFWPAQPEPLLPQVYWRGLWRCAGSTGRPSSGFRQGRAGNPLQDDHNDDGICSIDCLMNLNQVCITAHQIRNRGLLSDLGDSTGTTARVLRNDPRLNCGARLKRQALSLLMRSLIRMRVDLA
jgi:hypothetical protein